jgi:hypothetical protein
VRQRLRSSFQAKGRDLVVLKDLIKAGEAHTGARPNFPLNATREAIGYVGEVHPTGTAITV